MSDPAPRDVPEFLFEPAPAWPPEPLERRPAPAPSAPEAPRPGVRVVRRRRRHHLGFAVLSSIVVGGMVFGILWLNVLLAQQSFRIDAVERRIEELSTQNLDLVREQATLSAPGRIAAWARRNGMRLPDDIRSLHASGARAASPAGAADPSGGNP